MSKKQYIGVTKPLNIVSEAKANIDAKYGTYISIQEAIQSIVKESRAIGLTVGIIENGVVKEYWWKTGTDDQDLILKIDKAAYTKISELENDSKYYTEDEVKYEVEKETIRAKKAEQYLTDNKVNNETFEALMNGIIKQPGVDTYNTGTNSLAAIYGLTAGDNGTNGKAKQNGWDVLVREDETKGGKSIRYNWNASVWVDMETGIYNDNVAIKPDVEKVSSFTIPNAIVKHTPTWSDRFGYWNIYDSFSENDSFRITNPIPVEEGHILAIYTSMLNRITIVAVDKFNNSISIIQNGIGDTSGNALHLVYIPYGVNFVSYSCRIDHISDSFYCFLDKNTWLAKIKENEVQLKDKAGINDVKDKASISYVDPLLFMDVDKTIVPMSMTNGKHITKDGKVEDIAYPNFQVSTPYILPENKDVFYTGGVYKSSVDRWWVAYYEENHNISTGAGFISGEIKGISGGGKLVDFKLSPPSNAKVVYFANQSGYGSITVKTAPNDNKISVKQEVIELKAAIHNPDKNNIILIDAYSDGDPANDTATAFYGVSTYTDNEGTWNKNAIQRAWDSITDSSVKRRYIICAHGHFEAKVKEDFSARQRGYYSYISNTGKDYISLRGDGKDFTIIEGVLSNDLYIDYSKYQLIQAEADSVDFSSMTIVGENMRYPVHTDRSSIGISDGTANINYKQTWNNVCLEHRGNSGHAATSGSDAGGTWNNTGTTQAPLGLGIASGQEIELNNCDMITNHYSTYFHDNGDFLNPPKLVHNRCNLISKTDNVVAYFSLYGSKQLCEAEFNNCNFVGKSIIASAKVSGSWNADTDIRLYDRIIVKGSGNSPILWKPEADYGGLKITAIDETKDVLFDETSSAFDVIIRGINIPTYTDTFGKVYEDGYFRRNNYACGLKTVYAKIMFTQNQLAGVTLGERLGNCTTANKILSVFVGGVKHNIVFDKDYLNLSNNSILSEINAQLSGIAVASIFAEIEDSYLQFSDCISISINKGDSFIKKGDAVSLLSNGVQLASDTERIDGIALDNIKSGQKGRYLMKGLLDVNEWFKINIQNPIVGKYYKVENGVFVISDTPTNIKCTESNIIRISKGV